ncbi:FeoA domain-containing protein [Pseudodesulfovibrio sp.]|uniref:FeoA domain-containing protein n=1 Tax=unclassified Pseudodesulfovibrio TaxID=2661612 RepID=UPI003AFF8AAC
MYAPLNDAPTGSSLTIFSISDEHLEVRMGRMGLFVGDTITRMDEDVALKTVRVRGPKGEVVLGGGMGGKVMAHLDDGRMLPLIDMRPGDRGHVEYVNAGEAMRNGMAALGLAENDAIELIRVLPPMEYTALVAGRGRVRMAEGMAAKILGHMGEVHCQFANAQARQNFTVETIIGGHRAQRAINALGIESGSVLLLEMVGEAPSYRMPGRDRCVIAGPSGLRVYLRSDQADNIVVSYEEEEATR